MAIAAVFIALALGILIGVSFGDSVLVANQRDVIQLMEGQLEQLRENGRRQERELKHWAALQPLLRSHFLGALAGQRIVLIGPAAGEGAAVKVLLEEAGAAVVPLPLSGEEPTPGEAAALLHRLLDPVGSEPPFPEAGDPVLPQPPDCCLLLLETPADPAAGSFAEICSGLQEHGIRVILLFPWREGRALQLPEKTPELSLVDNIDTVWGQVALLQMIAEDIGGHYGFEKGSAGLFPGQKQQR